jgi:hypothetical protein
MVEPDGADPQHPAPGTALEAARELQRHASQVEDTAHRAQDRQRSKRITALAFTAIILWLVILNVVLARV